MTDQWDAGWLCAARACPSLNFDTRPAGADVSLLVLHNISLPPGKFGAGHIEALFCNTLDCSLDPYFARLERLRVSAHFLIDRNGALTQFVSCDHRAWHAGVSAWAGRENCNDFSIGVELEGEDRAPYEGGQYAALVELIRRLRRRYPRLGGGAVVGHSDIAPHRKTDPGPAFDWRRLRLGLRDLNPAVPDR